MACEIKTNKKAITWLSVAHLINDSYTGFLNPIMPFIAAKIGITMAVATFILSLSHLCTSLLQPIFGYFADNIIKRIFIFWGLILTTVFIPIAANAHNAYAMTLFIIIGMIGSSFFHPQATTFIIRFSKQDFSKNMAIFIAAGSIGFSCGPAVSGLIAEHLGLEVMPYSSIFGVLFALLAFKCVPKISNVDKLPEHQEFVKSMMEVIKHKYVKILIIISVMKSLITNSNVILLPFLWKGEGYLPSKIGIILFLFILSGAIGSLVSPKLEKIIGTKNIFYISMIGTLPLMWIYLVLMKSHPTIAISIFILMGFITMLAMPVNMVLAQKMLPNHKSIVSGFINGFSWGIAAVFMTLIGFLAQKFGIINILMFVAIIPAVFSVLIKKIPVDI